jgi:catalase (peroxidase I)
MTAFSLSFLLPAVLFGTVASEQSSSSSSSSDDYDVTWNRDICPGLLDGTPYPSEDYSIPSIEEYNEALLTLDIESVFDDLYYLFLDSQDCWPSDIFNGESSYVGLMLRLAWHCSGTFRITDGKGGCAGGRQRYLPESAWDDNVNLDKARALLAPIKKKYGNALSWGDLFVFAGTAAILQGNGPITQVCAGRIDNNDGTLSNPLNDDTTCNPQGNCQPPLGSAVTGLIYVDPTGFLGNPDPIATAPNVREIFSRMGMNDSETVALIGGGHAFGKAHGPCPDGPGPNPIEQPFNPWPGNCGNNFPNDVWTSGIEGAWTLFPFNWDNYYFEQLINDEYTLITGPGGKYQWYNNDNGLLMLTTDLALIYDDSFYSIVEEFANNIESLNIAFSHAWEKLTTSGAEDGFASNKFCIDGDLLRPDNGIIQCPKLCTNEKCNSNGNCNCEFDEYCDECPRNGKGCTKCDDGYFKKGWNYQCARCDAIFLNCQQCQDWKGCVQCKDGYNKKWDKNCQMWTCV